MENKSTLLCEEFRAKLLARIARLEAENLAANKRLDEVVTENIRLNKELDKLWKTK